MITNEIKNYVIEQKKLGVSFEVLLKDLEDKKLNEETVYEVAKFWYQDEDPNNGNTQPSDPNTTDAIQTPTSNTSESLQTENIPANSDNSIESDSVKIVEDTNYIDPQTTADNNQPTQAIQPSPSTQNNEILNDNQISLDNDTAQTEPNPSDDVLILDTKDNSNETEKQNTTSADTSSTPTPNPTSVTASPPEQPNDPEVTSLNTQEVNNKKVKENIDGNTELVKNPNPKPKGYTINTTPPPVMVGAMNPPKPKNNIQNTKGPANINMTSPSSTVTDNPLTQTNYGELEIVRDQLIKPKYVVKFAKFIAIVLVLAIVSAPFLITFNVIPVENKMVKNIAKRIVYAIPFIQPDPLYILENMVLAHKTNPSLTLDLALTSSSQNLLEFTEINKFELMVSGDIDYTDINNKKVNLKIAMPEAIDADVRVLNKDLYFKLNKVPASLTTFLRNSGIDTGGVLNNWVYTESNRSNEITDNVLNDEKIEIDPKNQAAFEVTRDYILNITEVETVELENKKLFKLTTRLTTKDFTKIFEEINKIYGDSNEIYKNAESLIEILNIELLIEKDTFYLANAIINTAVSPNSGNLKNYTEGKLSDDAVNFAIVYHARDFGKKATFIAPVTSISTEEFVARIKGKSAFVAPVTETPENENIDDTDELDEELAELGDDVTLEEPIEPTSLSPFGDIISRILNSQIQNQ